ncbi:uncharacterized protein LOC144994845 [Oryzias latipes]
MRLSMKMRIKGDLPEVMSSARDCSWVAGRRSVAGGHPWRLRGHERLARRARIEQAVPEEIPDQTSTMDDQRILAVDLLKKAAGLMRPQPVMTHGLTVWFCCR